MEPQTRGRGRPAGSVKPPEERRQRKDYRFSPATLHQIEQGRQLAPTPDETAFVEAAIEHYVSALTGKGKTHELAQPPIQDQPGASAITPLAQKQPGQPLDRKQPPAPPRAIIPSLRQPVYQIFLKHELGSHPHLPEGFDYIEQDECPTHLVSLQPGKLDAARDRAIQLQTVPGILSIWILDRKGNAVGRGSWRKEQGRWIRND